MRPPVAIAVVSWNTRDLLRSCLRSLAPEIDAGRAEVVVVDNGSGDGSAALVRDEFPGMSVIALDDNPGFGAAVNLAAARTSAPWIAAANADVELTRGALAQLLAAGEAHADAGIFAPRLLGPDGAAQHSVYPFPTLGFTLAFNLGLAGLAGHRWPLEGRWDSLRPRRVDWALGAFLLVRRDAWDAVGGFDPEQWMYAEDLDLGWRAAQAGFSTWYEPSAVVRHFGAAATAQAFGDARRERWMRSTYAWMRRRRGPAVTGAYGALNVAGALARAALLAPAAAVLGGARRAPCAEMVEWARLHVLAWRAAREEDRH